MPPCCEGQGFGPLHGEAAAWRRMAAMAGAAGPERVSSERVWCARVSSGAFLPFALSRGCAKPRSGKGRAECGRRCFLRSVALSQAPAQGLSSKSAGGDGCSLHSFILPAFVDTGVCHALMIQQWTGHAELRLEGEAVKLVASALKICPETFQPSSHGGPDCPRKAEQLQAHPRDPSGLLPSPVHTAAPPPGRQARLPHSSLASCALPLERPPGA